MKISFLLCVISLGLLNLSHGQVRPGDGSAPIRVDSLRLVRVQDSAGSAMLADVAAAYDAMEQNIAMTYAKLMKETKDNIEDLNAKIKELQEQIKQLKDMIAKLDKVMQQMEEERAKAMSSLEAEKKKALQETAALLRLKKMQEAKDHSQKIKLQTIKAREDSLRLIPLRYQRRS